MARTSLKQDEFQGPGFWQIGRAHELESPFDLSQILLVGGGLLVLCSLPGPPLIKQHMQTVTVMPG